jgi:hypothetical protein
MRSSGECAAHQQQVAQLPRTKNIERRQVLRVVLDADNYVVGSLPQILQKNCVLRIYSLSAKGLVRRRVYLRRNRSLLGRGSVSGDRRPAFFL